MVPADESGWLEATFRIDSMEAVIIDLLALSPHIEVMAPARLRDAVRARLSAALDLHRPLPSPDTQSVGGRATER